MQVRRRVSLFERPIDTATKAGRTRYGYSAYRRVHIEKLLGIFRVHYKYALKGSDRKTPAMRLGLATHTVKLDELPRVHEERNGPSGLPEIPPDKAKHRRLPVADEVPDSATTYHSEGTEFSRWNDCNTPGT